MSSETSNADLNIADFLREVWSAKRFLLCGVLLGFIATFVVVKVSVPQYQAQMMIGPAQSMDAPREARQGRFDGVSIEQQKAQRHFTTFEAMYRGAAVAAVLLRDSRIVEGLEADRSFVFARGTREWNAAVLSRYIDRRVWLDPFGETDLRQLNYRHKDAAFAAYFVQQIHRVTDQLIRAGMRSSVDQRISYLQRESAKVLNPEHRRVMTDLLMEQERARMIVLMDEPVAARVIEPASSSVKAVWPDKVLFYAGFGVIGLLCGYVAFSVRQMRVQGQADYAAKKAEALKRDADGRPLNYASWFKSDSQNNNVNYDEKRRELLKKVRDASE